MKSFASLYAEIHVLTKWEKSTEHTVCLSDSSANFTLASFVWQIWTLTTVQFLVWTTKFVNFFFDKSPCFLTKLKKLIHPFTDNYNHYGPNCRVLWRKTCSCATSRLHDCNQLREGGILVKCYVFCIVVSFFSFLESF